MNDHLNLTHTLPDGRTLGYTEYDDLNGGASAMASRAPDILAFSSNGVRYWLPYWGDLQVRIK